MHRDYQKGAINFSKGIELIAQTAFHEAGHAAAIYLRNKLHNIKPVPFYIELTEFNRQKRKMDGITAVHGADCQAMISGGLIVTGLMRPPIVEDPVSVHQQLAYEADMVNLLVGPLAEAKHVAHRDGELFSSSLITIEALKNYGGHSDLQQVNRYLDVLLELAEAKESKLHSLFLDAFHFVTQPAHWRAITNLAHSMLNDDQDRIVREDAIAIMDSAIKHHSR